MSNLLVGLDVGSTTVKAIVVDAATDSVAMGFVVSGGIGVFVEAATVPEGLGAARSIRGGTELRLSGGAEGCLIIGCIGGLLP